VDLSSKLKYGVRVDNTLLKDSVTIKYDWPEDEDLVDGISKDVNNYNRKDSVDIEANLPFELSKKDDIRLVYTENNNYIYGQNKVWQLLSEGLEDHVNDEQSQSIQLNDLASTLFQKKAQLLYTSPSNTFYVDIKTLQTNSDCWFYYKASKSHKIRLLFYRGLTDCEYRTSPDGAPSVGKYPMADYHNYDPSNAENGQYSLAFNSKKGLYDVWWKDWIEFLIVSKEVRLSMNLGITDILGLDFLKKVQLNNSLFYFDEIEFSITDKIGISSIKAIQIKQKYE
jgi:hypothetical protein